MTLDSLGDRMKRYELASRTVLTQRMPAILRIDGRAFHTYTSKCVRPFDSALMDAMDKVAEAICDDAAGAQIAYVQSDEISILLHDYKRFDSQPWFDKQVQKIVSVAASIAAATMTSLSHNIFGKMRRAHFDARVFVVPESDVCNYFVWRQQDAVRNSLQMLTRSLYSHAECDNKARSQLHEMCMLKGVNWNDLPTSCKRGRCVRRGSESGWVVDYDPPTFSIDRNYIEQYLKTETP